MNKLLCNVPEYFWISDERKKVRGHFVGLKTLIAVIALLFALPAVSVASDRIILKNGQEYNVKLVQITDEKVVYSELTTSTLIQNEVPSKDVYMVYIEKSGNVYFTAEGKRITGESQKADIQKYDVIYLVKGGEISVEKVRITNDFIVYTPKGKKSRLSFHSRGKSNDFVLEKQDVFMIRYKNGMRDIITSIEVQEVKEPEKPVVEEDKPQFVVVFHSVKRGENLEKIASRYKVTVKEIIDWNELPSKYKAKTPLASGMQLMIYQPK